MKRIGKTLDLDKLSAIRCIPRGCKRKAVEGLSSMGCRTGQEKMAALTALHPTHLGHKLQGLNRTEQRDGAAPPAKVPRLFTLPQLPTDGCVGYEVSKPEIQTYYENPGYRSLLPPHPALAAFPGEFRSSNLYVFVV